MLVAHYYYYYFCAYRDDVENYPQWYLSVSICIIVLTDGGLSSFCRRLLDDSCLAIRSLTRGLGSLSTGMFDLPLVCLRQTFR